MVVSALSYNCNCSHFVFAYPTRPHLGANSVVFGYFLCVSSCRSDTSQTSLQTFLSVLLPCSTLTTKLFHQTSKLTCKSICGHSAMWARQSPCKHHLVTILIQATAILTDASVIAAAYVDHSNFNHINRCQLGNVNTEVTFLEMLCMWPDHHVVKGE